MLNLKFLDRVELISKMAKKIEVKPETLSIG